MNMKTDKTTRDKHRTSRDKHRTSRDKCRSVWKRMTLSEIHIAPNMQLSKTITKVTISSTSTGPRLCIWFIGQCTHACTRFSHLAMFPFKTRPSTGSSGKSTVHWDSTSERRLSVFPRSYNNSATCKKTAWKKGGSLLDRNAITSSYFKKKKNYFLDTWQQKGTKELPLISFNDPSLWYLSCARLTRRSE